MGLERLLAHMYPAIAWSSLSQQAKKRLNKLLGWFVDLRWLRSKTWRRVKVHDIGTVIGGDGGLVSWCDVFGGR